MSLSPRGTVTVLVPALLLTLFWALPVDAQRRGDDDLYEGASSLAFVFDITGSMYDDLVQVIKGAAKILATTRTLREKPLYNYVLVPFHDPEVGPILSTRDHYRFLNELQDLYVQGGGDCPEMSVSAIKEAIDVSLPNSFIYVFTDARSKDFYLTDEVLALIQRKQSQVVFVLTGDCGEPTHNGYRAYEQIASTSSGQVFKLKKSQVNEVLNFVEVAVRSRKVNLMSVDIPVASQNEFNISIDSKLQEITFSVSGQDPMITLIDPAGNKVTKKDGLNILLDISKALVVNLDKPMPGVWKLVVESDDKHTIRATGLSTLNFVTGFSKDPVENIADTEHRPIGSIPTHMMINVTEPLVPPAGFTLVEIIDLQGKVLGEHIVTPDDKNPNVYRVPPFIPPEKFFYIKLTGVDERFYSIQRLTPTAITRVVPGRPNVYMPEISMGYFGLTAVLVCRVESLVPVTVRWYKTDEILGPDQKYEGSVNATHEIPGANQFSEGMYFCEAENSVGSAKVPTFLDISEPPPSITTPQNVSVLPGEDAMLTCNVFSTVNFNVSWYSVGYRGKLRNSPKFTDFNNGSLLIRKVHRGDEGKYTCVASNEGGNSEQDAYVRVQVKPIATVTPEESSFVAGSTHELVCTATGFPEPKIHWLRGGKKLESDANVQIQGNTLMLLNMQRGNEGHYECLAANRAGEDSRTASLFYIEEPKITLYKSKVLVASGDDAVLLCAADGIPAPEIKWFKGEIELKELSYVQITYDGQLKILETQDVDAGEYTCKAVNDAGEDSVDIVLEVGAEPSFLLTPENIGADIGTTAQLDCQSEGLPEPDQFWKRDDGHNLMLGNRIYTTQTGSLVIEDVGLADEGNYVCVADNQFGVATTSAYLTITGIVTPLIGYMDPFIQARQGESVSLSCQAMLGNPPPIVFWVNHGRVLQEDEHFVKNGEGNIVIEDVQDFHAGDYTCVASNVGGNASFVVSLDIQVPPVFVFNYSDPDAMKTDFVIVEGDGVVLPCNVEGDPRPEITWYKDESPISFTDFHYFIGDDGSLEIFSAEAIDTGSYRCQASNEAGEIDRSVDLFVQVQPTIDGDQEEKYVVNVNETVVLPCEVHGNPKPEVRWRKKFVAFDPNAEGFLVGDHGITIPAASIEDKAIYECVAQNEAGHTFKVFALIVQIPPKILRGTDEEILTVQKGDEVVLDCENTGDPEPLVEWYKEEAVLSVFDFDDNMSIEGSGSLYIDSAMVSDSGAYFCKVENPAGTITKDFTLHVLDPPSLPANLSEYTDVPESNPIILNCPATGTPVPLITWYKDGQLITGDQLGVIILEDGSLEISDTRGDDSAKYKCVAENDAGKVDHEIELKVLVPPKLTGKDSGNPGVIDNTNVVVTNNISLTCPVEADPKPTITWLKDNVELDLTVRDPRYSVSANGKVLTITLSEVPDTARYTCKAENVAGQVEKIFDLDVHVPPEVDEKMASPDNSTVVIAQGLYLDCPVKGIPIPNVIWRKDGEVIFPDLDPNINLRGDGRRLEIVGARVTDTGRYTCVGENVAGNTEKDFDVAVLVPPKIDKPAQINKPEVVRDRSLTLKCPVSGIPLPTITWYKGNLKITDDMPEFTLQDMGWTLQINSAQVHDSTRFTCRAENPAGKGEKAFDVSVFVPPSINKAGVDDKPSVIVNQSTIINCPVDGKPTPTITWFKNDVRLDATVQSRYEILAGGRQLRVKYAQLEDTAKYKCEAANKAGEDSATFDLEVQVPTNIRLTNVDKNPKVIVGGTVKLSCPATGVPPPEITWQKNGIEIADGDIPNVSIQKGGKELTITGALEDDTAQYSCIALNIAGEKDVSYMVDVQVPPTIDPNAVNPTPHVEIGNAVTLDCPAEGTPIPDIIWLKDGQPIDYEKNIHYTLEADGRRLTVERSVVGDAGIFTCLAANAAGNVEQEYELDVWVEPTINSAKDELFPTVIKEHTAVLFCPVEGNPPPFIMWLKNGDPVQLDDRVHMEEDGRELRIKNATESDTARYQCVARNEAGQDSLIFNLEVHVPPSIDESNVVYQRVVLENRTIIIECPVSGIPKPAVTWKINKQPLVLRPGLSLTSNGYHLKLDSAQVPDSAIYYCIASNLAGELTKKFGLEVQVPPRIDVSQVQTEMVVTQNQTAVIHCPVTGIPVPLILWFKNDYVLRDWPYPDLSLSADRMTLKVVNAQVDDSGVYKCEATSASGLAHQEYTVEVQVPPQIVDSASTTMLSVVKGNSLTLPCVASGLPTPDLAWMKNKVTIETSENPQLIFGEDGEYVQIVNAEPSDSGTYDCHAENSAGVQVRTFVVEVQVPPSIPKRGTQKAWVVTGNSLTLECPVTGTPQPIITWIRQGREILQFGSQNLKLQNRGQRMEIVDAQLVDVGQYECVAKNEAGEERLMYEVSIYIPPTIEDGPTKEEADVRNPAFLSCESLGLPDPVVTWEKDGKVFPTKGLRHTMRTTGTIDFKFVQLEDAGKYRCTAKNEAGTATREIELEVQVPPTLIGKQPLTIESVANERVVLPCKVRGTPTPTIIWQKGAKVISGKDGFDILSDGSILIPSVKRKNSGVYICIARNNAGTAFGRVRLKVMEKPTINVRGTEFIIKSSDNVVLPCRAHGRPRPKISWLKNGRPIARSSAYVRILRSGLGFPYVRKDDTGVYTCIAKNKAGQASQEITLQVQVAPQIAVATRTVTFTLGDDATIECKATGIPAPKVEWLKAGRHIETKNSRKFQVSPNGNLEIRSVTKEDTGSYTCVAKNEAGRTSQERQVRVQVPPSFTVVPYNQEVTLNSRLKLRCTATGTPTPNVHWMKDSLPIEAPPSVVGRSVLVINSVRQDDTGVYRCLAQNPAGEASVEVFIAVKIPPEILTPPDNKAVVVAERVVLPCKVGGDPQPEVVWMKNGRQVQLSARIQQLSNGSLVIYSSTTSDAGEYKCMATNDFGTSMGVAMLTIREPPSFEIEPVDTVVDEGENVLIDCVGSGEPVPVMEWMVGWDVLENKGRLSILPNNSLSIVAAQLSDSMTYRCLASNNLGKSFIEVNLTVVVHGEWSDWSGWEPCSSTCGEGRQHRHRSCDDPEPANQGRHCPGIQTDTRTCMTRRCPALANWGSWNHWSACTLSCGSGVRTRRRRCNNPPPATRGSYCIGPEEQRDYCNSEPCPVHGGWSSWNDFGECSASCEGGLQRRFRSCSNPQPSNGGRQCPGTGVDTQSCNQIQCPVDGLWSEWSDWSACSKSCDQGTKQRNRLCRRPMHRGQPCIGDEVQRTDCFVQKCYDFPIRAEGNLIGYINNIQIPEGTFTADMLPQPDNSATNVNATINNIPPTLVPHFRHLVSILTPVYWSTAQEVDGATNGFRLTNGEFAREVQVQYATGEILKMSQYSKGVDQNGKLQMDIVVRGSVPEFNETEVVVVSPYWEQYLQTGLGTLHAQSTRLFYVDDNIVPYAWNHSITYSNNQVRMPYLVQRLYARNIVVKASPERESINFIVDASILPGAPSNQCPSGFLLNQDGIYCEDEDECAALNPCSDYCHNSRGGFSCSCPIGFALDRDGRQCVDLDECLTGFVTCDTDKQCINTIGSYKCEIQCSRGYRPSDDGRSCIDIDECSERPNMCDQICVNKFGGYRCRCMPGYRLSRGRCEDIDECELSSPPCEQVCANAEGNYLCSCRQGYELVTGGRCRDINECTSGRHDCSPLENCMNTLGSFNCVTLCPKGAHIVNGRCTDIDECSTGKHRCYYNQRCVNSDPGYRCLCDQGYTSAGPGTPCLDLDECEQIPSVCTYKCQNTYGDYECICPPGQVRLADRKSCAGLEFLEPVKVIDTNSLQTQSDTHGSYNRHPRAASCSPGLVYSVSQGDCIDRDECTEDPGICQHNCTNTFGSYTCSCPPGYRADKAGICHDIDECIEMNIKCGTDKMCFNTRGEFTCIDIPCPRGHQRDPITNNCVLECIDAEVACPPNAKYADVIEFRTLALPSGVLADKDLILLTAYNQDDVILRKTKFKLLQNDKKVAFNLRVNKGEGIVYTPQPLEDKQLYKIKVKAESYDNQEENIQYQTTFMIHISVSAYKY